MAKKRVIAYFMHEEEQHAAQQALSDSESTESFVMGELDEEEIDDLRAKGLILRVLDDEEPAPPSRGEIPFSPGVEAEPLDPEAETYYSVKLKGPLLSQWRDQLKASKAEVVAAQGGDRYTLRCHPSNIAAVAQLDFVQQIPRYFQDQDSGSSFSVRADAAPIAPAAGAAETFELLLHRQEESDKVVDWLSRQASVIVLGAQRRKIRFISTAGSGVPEQAKGLPEVSAVHPYLEPELHNDRARRLLGLDSQNSPTASLPWTGRNQLVGVADSGLDQRHPDFQGRIRQAAPLGRPGDASDPHGHGTHVAGSILGDGSASSGELKGVAPEAELYFQSIMDARGKLGGLPWDLFDLFDPPYQSGVRIHNNSWGADAASEYTVNSIEVDEFVAEHPDFLVVISAGNDGIAANPRNSRPGFVDWLSIGAPASCKNALTVGASRSDRTAGGFSDLTYRDVWPGEFPDDPIGGARVSGDPEAMAGFSSRGPCTDRRIKPDVVAPGTDILSTRASTAPLRSFWGPFPGNPRYAYMGGTSMAAPLATGCAAVVRQFYVDDRGHEPSAALLKATLINGARWLSGADSGADFANAPNFHQGFGCIHLPTSLAMGAGRRLEFVDSWRDPALQFDRTGQRFRWDVGVDGGEELRFCLVWTDPPARALQNNLNLIVETPSGAKLIGNQDLPQSITPVDVENNVEVIRVQNPAPGNYLVQVMATNLVMTDNNQAFALVASGRLSSGLVQR